MTTIAFDGETMSGDKQTTWGGTPVKTRKVHKILASNGAWYLLGCSGNSYECKAYENWLRGLIPEPELEDVDVMVIDASRRIWVSDESKLWLPVSRKQWALGCGANYALGAMAMGANSRQAVKVAIGLDVNSGLGIDTVKF